MERDHKALHGKLDPSLAQTLDDRFEIAIARLGQILCRRLEEIDRFHGVRPVGLVVEQTHIIVGFVHAMPADVRVDAGQPHFVGRAAERKHGPQDERQQDRRDSRQRSASLLMKALREQ